MSPPWFVFEENREDVVPTTSTSFLERKEAKEL